MTAGAKQVRMEGFVINTFGEESFITGLVVANGKFLGRVKLFDLELPSDLTLPIDAKDGDFFLSGVKINLDPVAATALNEAFGVTTFANNLYVGNALSLVFVPLSADGL